MDLETALKLGEVVATIALVTGLYWKGENKRDLLTQKCDMRFAMIEKDILTQVDIISKEVNINKQHNDESINRLIKSMERLETTIERLNEKLINKI